MPRHAHVFAMEGSVVIPEDFFSKHVAPPETDGAVRVGGAAADGLKLLHKPGHLIPVRGAPRWRSAQRRLVPSRAQYTLPNAIEWSKDGAVG